MKRNWLLYLVIFSLALNLGTISTLVYLRYYDQDSKASEANAPPPLPMRELWRALHLEEQQRQTMRQLLPEHRRRVMAARQSLAQKRQELFNLIKGEDPQWEALQAKIREISALQGGLEEEMTRFMLDLKKNLKPEQHEAFAAMVQRRLNHMMEHMGPGHGPMGPRMGKGMGRGPKGMGPKGPMGMEPKGPMEPMVPPPPPPPD